MKKVFTTGQVAKICQVAPRTVSKWFDSGRLKGYRIPGSQDRRIPRESRRRLPLVESAGEIAWVPGVATSERFRVTEATSQAVHLGARPLA